MIRSALSVSLSLCWSAPRRPNHQSKFLNIEFLSKCLRLSFASVFCLMWFTPRVLNRHISTPGDPKNHQIWSPKTRNSWCKTLLQQDCLKGRSRSSIFRFFYRFLKPPGPPKIEPKSQKSEKKSLKFDVEKSMLFNTIFSRLFFVSTL